MSEKKAKLNLLKDAAELNPLALMGDINGIYFTYKSDMESIANILPPNLEPAFPMVSGYVANVDKPSFSEPYREAMLGVYVKVNGSIGMYPVAFLLSGPGAEMATYLGREKTGLPKKICEREDCIRIERNGDVMRGIVERKGVMLVDVSLKIGEYNNSMTGNIYSNPEAGKVTGGVSYYFLTAMEPDEKGMAKFKKVNMLSNVAEYTYKKWEPGKVTVRLQSSSEDAWGQLPVLENMGGANSISDLEMKELYIVDTPDPEEVIPYLLTTRFDKSALKGGK